MLPVVGDGHDRVRQGAGVPRRNYHLGGGAGGRLVESADITDDDRPCGQQRLDSGVPEALVSNRGHECDVATGQAVPHIALESGEGDRIAQPLVGDLSPELLLIGFVAFERCAHQHQADITSFGPEQARRLDCHMWALAVGEPSDIYQADRSFEVWAWRVHSRRAAHRVVHDRDAPGKSPARF